MTDNGVGSTRGSYVGLSWRSTIRRLLGQIGTYGTGNALQKMSAFILLPLYLWRLTPEEYGLFSLVGLLPFVLTPVFQLGLPTTITRYYYEWLEDGSSARHLGAIWAMATAAALGMTLLLDRFGEAIFKLVLVQVPFDPYGRLGLWWTFLAGLSTCPMMLLRIREQGRAYVAASQLSYLLGIGLTAWAVLAGWGVIGILWMQVISTAVAGVVLSSWYLAQVEFRLTGLDLVRPLRLALPLVPSSFLEALAARVDRFFLDKWVPLQEIGIYSLANQLGQGVKFFADSVKPAIVPFYIRVAKERSDAKAFLGRAGTFYVAASAFVALVVLVVGPLVVTWFAPSGRYDAALPLLPIMVASYFFQGLVPLGTLAILVAEQTVWQPLIQGVQLVVAVTGNAVLTPAYGAAGAAWALLAAGATQAVLYLFAGQRAYPVRMEWGRVAAVTAGGGLVAAVALALSPDGSIIATAWLVPYGLWVAVVLRNRPGAKPSAVATAQGRLREAYKPGAGR